MARALVKLSAGAGVLVVLAAVLLVLVVNARHRGRLSYCRNNLRCLGMLAHSNLMSAPDDPPEERGRAFWQWIRERTCYSRPTKRWSLKWAGLNPFGCPVRGAAHLDLSTLPGPEYERVMSDPATIDYRGPAQLATPVQGRLVLGADREGNHPRGGHVLFVDLSVTARQEKSIQVGDDWPQAAGTRD